MPNFLGEHGAGELSTPTTEGPLKLLELSPTPLFLTKENQAGFT